MTDIRALNDAELGIVAGGTDVCTYEAGGKCYVWQPVVPTWKEIFQAWADLGKSYGGKA